jgi:hypothetical protein
MKLVYSAVVAIGLALTFGIATYGRNEKGFGEMDAMLAVWTLAPYIAFLALGRFSKHRTATVVTGIVLVLANIYIVLDALFLSTSSTSALNLLAAPAILMMLAMPIGYGLGVLGKMVIQRGCHRR